MTYRAEIDRLLKTMPPDWKRQWAVARQELRRLDYDAPAQPDASDVMQALYLTAGGRESGDKVVGTVPVPAAVRDEAMRAIRMAHRHNYGAWHMIGLARAVQLATVPRIDTRSVERMRAFFTRHAKDARAPHFGDDRKPSRGYLAHLVWGGDPAREWVMGMERKMRRNPLAKPTERMAFTVRKGAIHGVVEIYLYDIQDLDISPERAMIAGAMLVAKEHRGKVRWEAMGMAACPGYGPLIYDLSASVLGCRLFATRDQSEAAKRFWSRQPKRYVDPLPPEQFAAKYGITMQGLYEQGVEIEPRELLQMSDATSTVFFGAKEAEAAGKTLTFERCAPVKENPKKTKRNGITESPAFRRWFGNSKVVDAEGRPLVVYTGTFADFSVFGHGRSAGATRLGYWFDAGTVIPNVFAGGKQSKVSGGNIIPAYLSLQNPKEYWSDPLTRDEFETIQMLRFANYHGVENGEDYPETELEQRIRANAKALRLRPAPLRDLRAREQAVFAYLRHRGWRDSYEKMLLDLLPEAVTPEGRPQWVAPDIADRARERLAQRRDGVVLHSTLTDWNMRKNIYWDHPDAYRVREKGDEVRHFGSDWYLPLRPTQIKSATGNIGTFDPTDPDIRHNPKTAKRADPTLWKRIVREITAGAKGGLPGQWSARKAQLAVLRYKKAGGRYLGAKTADLGLVKWTRERWRTRSGRPSLVTGERYLPTKALAALTPQEYGASTRAKRAGLERGEQFTKQPERIAKKTARFRKNKEKP